MAALRSGYVEIDGRRVVIAPPHGSRALKMWSGERVDIRELLFTHEVVPGNVIAALPFLVADDVRELDGAMYPW